MGLEVKGRIVQKIQNMRRIQHAIADFEHGEDQIPRNSGRLKDESHPQLTDSKETEISVLQPQGTKFKKEEQAWSGFFHGASRRNEAQPIS